MKDKKNIEDIYPLTDNQLSFLLNHIRFKDNDSGQILVKAQFKGPLNENVFVDAWTAVMDKHASLRTSIHWQNLDRPLQVVHKKATVDIRFSHLPVLEELHEMALSLERLPNHRLTVSSRSDDEHTIFLICHHAFMDGWSTAIVLEDLTATYKALISADSYVNAVTKVPQFKDYLNWLKSCDLDGAREFWLKNDLFTGKPMPVQSQLPDADVVSIAHQLQVHLDGRLTALLQNLSDQCAATLSEVVQAAWSIFLAQLSHSMNVGYVLTLSGRSAPISGIETIVGQLSTALPIQVELKNQDNLIDIISRIRQENNTLRNYDYLSLQQLGKWGYHQNGLTEIQINNQTHAINSLIVVENFTTRFSLQDTDHTLQLCSFESGIVSNYPMTLIVLTHADGIRLRLMTNHIALSADINKQLLASFKTLFENLLLHPERVISDQQQKTVFYESSQQGANAVTEDQAVITSADNKIYQPPRTETQDHLQKIWQDIFATKNKISIDADYFELGGTSLNVVAMFARIESRFGCNLPISSILNSPTIETLAALISQPQDSLDQIIVPIQTKGEKRPVFGIHAQDILFYRDISKALGNDQPFYAVQQRDVSKTEEFNYSSISQMASEYITEIKKIQKNGPYTIIGLCMGCTIGYEIAHQLETCGEKVNVLIMFDPDLPELVFTRKPFRLREFTAALNSMSLKRVVTAFNDRLLEQHWFYQLALLKGQLRIARKSRAGLLEKQRAIRRHYNWQLNRKFKPQYFDGNILIIQSGEYFNSMNREFNNSQDDLKSSATIQTEILGGSHTNIFSPPKVYATAAIITQYSSSI